MILIYVCDISTFTYEPYIIITHYIHETKNNFVCSKVSPLHYQEDNFEIIFHQSLFLLVKILIFFLQLYLNKLSNKIMVYFFDQFGQFFFYFVPYLYVLMVVNKIYIYLIYIIHLYQYFHFYIELK